MVSIPSNSNMKDGKGYWEKNLVDVNNVDENFGNARDLGYTRLNYSRQSAVGKLEKYDSVDIYKTQVQSNGKLTIALRTETDEKVLDLSKYDAYLDELKQQTDPEGYKKEQEEKRKQELEQDLLELTAPGMKMEVYMVKNGREVLVGDSSADKGSKTREALDGMLKGEYKAQKGNYYVKVSRAEDVSKNEEKPYVLQIQMGKEYKHDYAVVEKPSEDTKNKKESKIPMTSQSGGLSAVNALQIQASRHQATAQMLQIGYLNMADIYSKNSKY